MTTNRLGAASSAHDLEAELAACPPAERGVLMLDIAERLRDAGEDDRAAELLVDTIALGGVDGGNARVSMAALLFDQGRDEDAHAQLAALGADDSHAIIPCLGAADLFEMRDEPVEALRWYDLAASRLDEAALTDFRATGTTPEVLVVLSARREIRAELELPVDELDELVDGADAVVAAVAEETALAEQDPDERAWLLLDAAVAWHDAGELDRAARWFTEVVAGTGEQAARARVGLAWVLFDQDRDLDARAMLADVDAADVPYPLVYAAGAEAFCAHDDVAEALAWYDRAYELLLAPAGSELVADEEFADVAERILVGRLEVRELLGVPMDDLDEAAVALMNDDESYFSAPPVGELRIPVWLRSELPHARDAWPELFADVDGDEVFQRYETLGSLAATAGVARVVFVPLTVDALTEFAARTGAAAGDEETVRKCADDLAEQGAGQAWPPGRNDPCWCGSLTKYKKCCGHVGARSDGVGSPQA